MSGIKMLDNAVSKLCWLKENWCCDHDDASWVFTL